MSSKVYFALLALFVTYIAAANIYRPVRQISGQRVSLNCPYHFNCLLNLVITKRECQCQLNYQSTNWTTYMDCFTKNNMVERCPQQKPSQICVNFEYDNCYTEFQTCNAKYYGYVSPRESRNAARTYDLCNQKINGGNAYGAGDDEK